MEAATSLRTNIVANKLAQQKHDSKTNYVLLESKLQC